MDEFEIFLEKLAQSETGQILVRYLKQAEIHHADIRNLEGAKPEVRIDALKLLRSILLDKLLVLSGEIDPPDTDEYH